MATKLYLPSGGVPLKSPTPDAGWTDTSQFTRYPCATVKASTAISTVSCSDASNAQGDIIIGQWISNALDAGQTITGAQAISLQMRCSETAANNNLFMSWKVYVLSLDGVTINKTLIAKRNDATEVATTLTNRTDSASSTAGNYTTVAGDRIVIEVGLEGDPAGGNTHNGSLSIGDNAASDLPSDDATTTANNPNVILATDTLTFNNGLFVSVADNVTEAESVSRELIHSISVSDSVAVIDVLVNFVDTIYVQDVVTIVMTSSNALSVSVFDNVTAAENVKDELNQFISVVDNVTAANSSEIAAAVSVADNVTAAENVQIANVPFVFDSVAVSENIAMLLTLNISVADNVTAAENVSLLETHFISVVDNVTAAENTKVDFALAASVFDSVTVAENVSTLLTLNASVVDNVTVAETISIVKTLFISVFDNVTAAENVQETLTLFVSVFDSVTAAENISPQLILTVSVVDNVTAAETIARLLILERSVFDNVTAAEIILRTQVLNTPLIVDSVTASETIVLTETFNPSLIIDNVTASENIAILEVLDIRISDNVTVSDSPTAIVQAASDLNIIVFDNVTAAEAIANDMRLFVSVQDLINASESVQASRARSFVPRLALLGVG